MQSQIDTSNVKLVAGEKEREIERARAPNTADIHTIQRTSGLWECWKKKGVQNECAQRRHTYSDLLCLESSCTRSLYREEAPARRVVLPPFCVLVGEDMGNSL